MIETEHLLLRQWRASDFAPFAALNADSSVMEFFPARLTNEESDQLAARLQSLIAERGWGLWAAERKSDAAFIGFIGLHWVRPELPFAPALEVGWRLAKAFWGQGYAPEGARAALAFGFANLPVTEIVSMTARLNVRSERVMQKIGMIDSSEDFLHPVFNAGHPLAKHCLYRINAEQAMHNAAVNNATAIAPPLQKLR